MLSALCHGHQLHCSPCPTHREHPEGPSVHVSGMGTYVAEVMVTRKSPAAQPGPVAPSPQRCHLLGCQVAADRGGRGHHGHLGGCWAGRAAPETGEAASPGVSSCVALVCQAVAVLCPGSANICGAGGGHGPRAGLQHRGALGWAGRPERGRVPGVSSSSSWACRWE